MFLISHCCLETSSEQVVAPSRRDRSSEKVVGERRRNSMQLITRWMQLIARELQANASITQLGKVWFGGFLGGNSFANVEDVWGVIGFSAICGSLLARKVVSFWHQNGNTDPLLAGLCWYCFFRVRIFLKESGTRRQQVSKKQHADHAGHAGDTIPDAVGPLKNKKTSSKYQKIDRWICV